MAELTAIKFDTSGGASDALEHVRDNKATPRPHVMLADLAVVERHASGRTTVHTPHGDTRDGIGWGAIAGAFAFCALPPVAGLVAWAGAIGIGGAIGHHREQASVADDVIEELRGELTEGSSMLLLFGPAGSGEALAASVRADNPVKVLHYGFPDPVPTDAPVGEVPPAPRPGQAGAVIMGGGMGAPGGPGSMGIGGF